MKSTTAFKDKTLMITGGTGSFGNTVLKHFMNTDLAEIRIFSRDEKKQDDMRHRLQERSPELASKVRFFIGDVRNAQSVRDAMHGVDYIFHAAALKQVPSCEFFPMEAVRTNVIGTDNVLHAAIEEGVDRVVCLSTDKAAYPINAMGKSKAMMESIIYANARNGAGRTTICCTRYGNVMCSRGSVIPLFIDRIRKGEPLTVADPNMTRFLMNLDEAVDLVQFAFEHANPGDLFIQKAPASTIGDLAEAVQEVFGRVGTQVIGTRHGEKLFETLMTREERLRAEDMGGYYRVACDSRDLNYDKFVVDGEVETQADESYTSHNTERLDVEGTIAKIKTAEYVQLALEGREHEAVQWGARPRYRREGLRREEPLLRPQEHKGRQGPPRQISAPPSPRGNGVRHRLHARGARRVLLPRRLRLQPGGRQPPQGPGGVHGVQLRVRLHAAGHLGALWE